MGGREDADTEFGDREDLHVARGAQRLHQEPPQLQVDFFADLYIRCVGFCPSFVPSQEWTLA